MIHSRYWFALAGAHAWMFLLMVQRGEWYAVVNAVFVGVSWAYGQRNQANGR